MRINPNVGAREFVLDELRIYVFCCLPILYSLYYTAVSLKDIQGLINFLQGIFALIFTKDISICAE